MAATFVPGMQGIAPYLMGANALAKGDVGGAIGSVVAPAIGRSFDSANATAAIDASNRDSLFDAVINAERGYAPADPWESFRNGLDWTEFQRRWR
jgi:hypothetical protein